MFMKEFEMTIGRIFDVLLGSPTYILYIFFCAAILGALFQVFILIKEANKSNVYLSTKHFVWVYIFLLYIALVLRETDIGTIWIIGKYETLIRTEQIFPVPFGTFDPKTLYDSIMTYMLNIIMTIPFGFLLPLIWPEFRSIKKVAIAGFLFSLAIELGQLLNMRATTIDDILMNTLGAVIGCILCRTFYRAMTRTKEFKARTRASSAIIQNEAIIYLVCAFVGVFLFYNSLYLFPFDRA